MKKIFSMALLFAASVSAMAQVQFGPMAGLNLSNVSIKTPGTAPSPKMKVGFHVGAVANISLTDHLYLMPGILFSSKGFKMKEDATDPILGSYTEELSTGMNYLEVPVNVAYAFGEEGGGRFFIHAGPYIGYCFGGKMKYEISYSNGDPGESDDRKVEVGNDKVKDDVRPLDFGINGGVGYILPMGLFFKAQYGLGLANTLPGGDSDFSMKNNVIGVSVGFLLGGGGNRYR